jgi:REP element-mobilizing transposase RayT
VPSVGADLGSALDGPADRSPTSEVRSCGKSQGRSEIGPYVALVGYGSDATITGMLPRAPRRKRLRLPAYDYTGAGPYFVTVCTHRRECIFGTVVDYEMRPSAFGEIVAANWRELPSYYPGTQLDAFVVMPNHFHGILLLNQDGESNHRLPALMRAFKAFSTRAVNERRGHVGAALWQRGYYEHIIRNEASLERIRRYVVSNPAQWDLDEENPERRRDRTLPGRP